MTGSGLRTIERRRRKMKGDKDEVPMNPTCRREIGGLWAIPSDR